MGRQDWMIGLCMVSKKDVKMLEKQSIAKPQIGLGQYGFNGIERDQAPFHPGRIIFWETPLGSQSFESCSLLIENMATFGTDAD